MIISQVKLFQNNNEDDMQAIINQWIYSLRYDDLELKASQVTRSINPGALFPIITAFLFVGPKP